jgi:hypothetical protein
VTRFFQTVAGLRVSNSVAEGTLWNADKARMTVCEYRFESFNARGDEEYLERFAHFLDELFRIGWAAPEVIRHSAGNGWWLVSLYKEDGSMSQGSQA